MKSVIFSILTLVATAGMDVSSSQEDVPALLDHMEQDQYGRTPDNPVILSFLDSADDSTLPGVGRGHRPADAVVMTAENEGLREIFGGKARLRQARLVFELEGRRAAFDLVLVMPTAAREPSPVLVGLNVWGNHTIHSTEALRRSPEIAGMDVRGRGSDAHRWNLEELIDAGYAVVTAFRGEIAPDHPEHDTEGILSLFDQTHEESPMGAIGAWSWALSRLLDYASVMPEIDGERATVFGHSRLGKASLWAGAQDKRFTRVITNNSGGLGAALKSTGAAAPKSTGAAAPRR
jgi:hypothetical protein